jgi:hypothetical protein
MTSVIVVATHVHSLQREQSRLQLQYAVHDSNAQLAAPSQPVSPLAVVDVELLQRLRRLDTVVRLENDIASLHTQSQAAQARAVLLQTRRAVQRAAATPRRHRRSAGTAAIHPIDTRVSETPVRNISGGRCIGVGMRWPGTLPRTSLQPAHAVATTNTHQGAASCFFQPAAAR